MAGKRGRPSTYTPEIAAEICERLAAGESLLDICSPDFPVRESTVRGWVLDDHNGFAAKYLRARELGLEHEADEIKRLADQCREGEKVKRTETGERSCSKCDRRLKWQGGWIHAADKSPLCAGAKAEMVYETEVLTADMVERSKLQIDARKWRLSKMLPKRYGDRLELAGDKDAPLQTRVVIELVDSPKAE